VLDAYAARPRSIAHLHAETHGESRDSHASPNSRLAALSLRIFAKEKEEEEEEEEEDEEDEEEGGRKEARGAGAGDGRHRPSGFRLKSILFQRC